VADMLGADVVVIGMGPGGEDVAGRLAEAGLEVVGVERQLLGGECPYWGCVPSKIMIRAANLLAEARRIPGVAGDATVRPEWGPVARGIRDQATDDWDDRVAVERFEGKGGRFVRGEGRIVAPGPSGRGSGRHVQSGPGSGRHVPGGRASGERVPVAVGDRIIEARRGVVVATGTHAVIPPIPSLEHGSADGRHRHGAAGGAGVPYWTNREAIEAKELPSSLIVLGAGSVGVELAQVFARFEVEVTVVEALDRLMPGEEPEAGELLAEVFARARLAMGLDDGTRLAAARLPAATGRRADLAAVGLGAVGVDESQRWVPVDEHLRVTDGVWAVGDITGKGAYTHVAMYQSAIAVAYIMGEPHVPADYRALPRVTFTDPEIGAVGLTEAQARAAGVAVRTGVALVHGMARGWIHKDRERGRDQAGRAHRAGCLGGGHGHGPAGGEVLGTWAVVVHARVPTEHVRQMIYAYPTFHRGIEDALRDLAA
jgi:pyruvate/2-oxoglutarate dehydrogenase complex dihydrolipoamide dehydrogenase (E3) component